MVYTSVSIENVIGRVIRNTKLTDTSAIMDIYEWIPEAMELLETQYQMSKEFQDLDIIFHQAKLPCGLVIVDAVEYKGHRIPTSNTSSNVKARPVVDNKYSSTVMQSNTVIDINPVTGEPFVATDLVMVSNLPQDRNNFYYTKLNYICTSMKEACIRMFYQIPPLDENGFPLIPDNGNYKEALYWWVRGKLIGSGQLDDRNNTENSCLNKFELYGGRAINEITYPSVDQMERLRANQVRFIAPENYWESHYQI